MRVLVTGGTGFIGSHLVEALIRRGDVVRCLVRKTSGLKWLKGHPVELVYGDCGEKASLREAVKGVDHVFHLAGATKALAEETYFEVNAEGTKNLIEVCLEDNPGLQAFVYLSSQAAAGPCQDGQSKRESDECEPVSPYGRSKRRGEEFALAHRHELPLVILRPSAVYGPRERDIYTYLKLLSRGIQPCLAGQEQYLSLVYVDDVVDATLRAAEMQDPKGDIFFISDGQEYRMGEVGDIFAEAMGVSPVRVPLPPWVIFGVASFSELWARFSGKPALINRGKVEEMIQRKWVCDITQARRVLCFEPRVSLREGARLTVDWYRRHNWL